MAAEIQNAERLLQKLRRIPQAAKVSIREAMAEQADEVVAFMKRRVPVDEGDLRDSIGWRWGSRAPAGSIGVATVGARDSDLTITIFAGGQSAFHARWVEFGTVKMAARPFFFVSWRANRKHIRRRIQAAVRAAARRVAAGG